MNWIGHLMSPRPARPGQAPGWAWWITPLGWALGVWLVLLPHPYLLVLALNAAALPVFLGLAARWPGRFTFYDAETDELSWRMVNGLAMIPAVALFFRAMSENMLIDDVTPFLVGGAVGVLLTGLYWLIGRKLEDSERMISLVTCGVWGVAMALLVNVTFDTAPGVVQAGTVTGRHEDRGKNSEPGLSIHLAIDGGRTLRFDVEEARLRATKLGDKACVEVDPGLFGWRSAWLTDCVQPLKTLTPPAPSAPSPPR